MDLASRSHLIQIEKDRLFAEVIKLDESDDDKFTKRQRAMKQIVCSLYSNKLKMDRNIVKELNIEKMNYEQKIVNDKRMDYIHVTFKELDDMKKVKKNLKNLENDQNIKVTDCIPLSLMDRYKIYDNIAYELRKRGKQTRIWAKIHGFYLRVKDRSDLRMWGEIPPIITPKHMPLARVGKIKHDTEKEVTKEENYRIENILERKNNKEKKTLYIEIADREIQR